MKVIRLLHFEFPAKLGGQKVCLMHHINQQNKFNLKNRSLTDTTKALIKGVKNDLKQLQN